MCRSRSWIIGSGIAERAFSQRPWSGRNPSVLFERAHRLDNPRWFFVLRGGETMLTNHRVLQPRHERGRAWERPMVDERKDGQRLRRFVGTDAELEAERGPASLSESCGMTPDGARRGPRGAGEAAGWAAALGPGSFRRGGTGKRWRRVSAVWKSVMSTSITSASSAAWMASTFSGPPATATTWPAFRNCSVVMPRMRSSSRLVSPQVTIAGTRFGALTNEAGRYVISGVPAGVHVVRVVSRGHRPQSRTVTVAAGERVNVDFALEVTATQLAQVVSVQRRRVPAATRRLIFER
jgi:Carboxypeptidase regulatory-like domain